MRNLSKQTLGLPLCIIFGVSILGWIDYFLCGKLGLYDFFFSSVYWIISNFLITSSFLCIGRNCQFSNSIANIFAYVLGGIYSIFLVSSICFLTSDVYLISKANLVIRMILPIICAVGMGLILGWSKIWLSAKIFGTLSFVSVIFSTYINLKEQSVYESFLDTNDISYMQLYDKLNNVYLINGSVALGLFCVSLILTIAWLNKSDEAPSIINNSTDII